MNKGLKHKEMQELTSYIYCKERLLKYNIYNILYNYVQSVSVHRTDSVTRSMTLLNSRASENVCTRHTHHYLYPGALIPVGILPLPVWWLTQAKLGTGSTASATRNDAKSIRMEITIIRIHQLYNAMHHII